MAAKAKLSTIKSDLDELKDAQTELKKECETLQETILELKANHEKQKPQMQRTRGNNRVRSI